MFVLIGIVVLNVGSKVFRFGVYLVREILKKIGVMDLGKGNYVKIRIMIR